MFMPFFKWNRKSRQNSINVSIWNVLNSWCAKNDNFSRHRQFFDPSEGTDNLYVIAIFEYIFFATYTLNNREQRNIRPRLPILALLLFKFPIAATRGRE